MKVKFRIIKICLPPNYYEKKQKIRYYIQKKGWFGWKMLEEVYDGNWASHFTWSYFKKPGHYDFQDSFETRKKAISFLTTFYRRIKPCAC